MMHWCGGCKTWKDAEEFHRDRSRSSGRRRNCKLCRKLTATYTPPTEERRRYNREAQKRRADRIKPNRKVYVSRRITGDPGQTFPCNGCGLRLKVKRFGRRRNKDGSISAKSRCNGCRRRNHKTNALAKRLLKRIEAQVQQIEQQAAMQ